MFFDYLTEYRSETIDLTFLFVINWFCLFDIGFRLFQGVINRKDELPYVSKSDSSMNFNDDTGLF